MPSGLGGLLLRGSTLGLAVVSRLRCGKVGLVSLGQSPSSESQTLPPKSLPFQSAFLDTTELAVSLAAIALMGAHVTRSRATASAQLAGRGTSVRAVSGFWEAGSFCQVLLLFYSMLKIRDRPGRTNVTQCGLYLRGQPGRLVCFNLDRGVCLISRLQRESLGLWT